MEMQVKFVTKEEAYKMIDEMPDEKIMVITFNNKKGSSDNGRMIKKQKGKKMANNASTIVLSENYPLATLSLHKSVFTNFTGDYSVDKIVKSILLTHIK